MARSLVVPFIHMRTISDAANDTLDPRILNLILLHKPPPQRLLITRRLPLHIEDLLARPNEFFGVAMTHETPLHGQWLGLPYHRYAAVQRELLLQRRHPVHTTVARHTADSLVDVNTVVEVHIRRQVIDALPR